VGAFLSGGLDSSLIAALMSRLSQEPVRAYTIVFDEQDKLFEAMPDDQKYARTVASHIRADHREILVQPDIVQLLPKLIWHLDEPIADPAAINTYLICKAAKERGTTVMLSGMGADEVFAGYRKHLSVYLAGAYKRFLPPFVQERLIGPAIDRLPVAGPNGGYRLFRWAKRFTKSASLPDMGCFIGNYTYYNADEINDLLHPDLRVEWQKSYPIQRHYDHLAHVRDRDLISQMTYLDAKLFLPSLNLTYSDKASMATAVEERVPFVDHEVMTFALNLPSKYRLRGLTQKYLLKKLGLKYLPKEVVYRPKAPFGAPLRAWMHRDLGPLVDDLLSEESVRRRGYFRYEAIRKMIEDNRNRRQDYGHRLWALLTIELWHRIFIDRSMRPSQSLQVDLIEGARKPPFTHSSKVST
jgi:asparagine synthase (glutamine-hydrolysing)